MSIFTKFWNALKGIFTSQKAQQAFDTVAAIIPRALPIVKAIAAMTPTRADDEIIAAFEKYAVPFDTAWLTIPAADRGAALLKLATAILAREFPGVATNILNSAVQFAVTGDKANKA